MSPNDIEDVECEESARTSVPIRDASEDFPFLCVIDELIIFCAAGVCILFLLLLAYPKAVGYKVTQFDLIKLAGKPAGFKR